MNDDTARPNRRWSRHGDGSFMSDNSANSMGPQPALSIAVLLDLGMSRTDIANYFRVEIERVRAFEVPKLSGGRSHSKDTPEDR